MKNTYVKNRFYEYCRVGEMWYLNCKIFCIESIDGFRIYHIFGLKLKAK